MMTRDYNSSNTTTQYFFICIVWFGLDLTQILNKARSLPNPQFIRLVPVSSKGIRDAAWYGRNLLTME